MLSLPEQLTTERLCLRQIEESDAEAIHNAILASHKTLAPWVDWLTQNPSLEERIAFCKSAQRRFQTADELTLGLWVTSSGAYAGTLSVMNIKPDVPKGGIGYWGNTLTQGKGYISEALREVCTHFLQALAFKRLWLTCDASNSASQRVAEHSGFSREALLKNERRNNRGQLADTLVYARTQE